jgi:hypothetical protein
MAWAAVGLVTAWTVRVRQRLLPSGRVRRPGLSCGDPWWAWQVLNLRPLPCEEGTSLLSGVGNVVTCTSVLAACLAESWSRVE